MTLALMRKHIGAACWHLERAAEEAPSLAALPLPVRALMIDGKIVNLDTFGIDLGHIAEQGRADTHIGPGS